MCAIVGLWSCGQLACILHGQFNFESPLKPTVVFRKLCLKIMKINKQEAEVGSFKKICTTYQPT